MIIEPETRRACNSAPLGLYRGGSFDKLRTGFKDAEQF